MGYKRKPVTKDPVTEEVIADEQPTELGSEHPDGESTKSSKETESVSEPDSTLTETFEELTEPVDRPPGQCCATCIVYKDTDRKHGRCRLKASTKDGFPIVLSTHWCEDYQAV